jgi:D-beta-D-heptose 7-phosphate kinase/D-beta-D-heptose 1-phosphate adenosyltransferase
MKKKIWVNGTFDVLHVGHIALLKEAASLGDYLVVGIDSDERVKELKGNDRPINKVEDRVTMLEAIRYINEVVVFRNDYELSEWIKFKEIDIMLIGDDYKNKKVIGSENANELKFFKRVEGYSTTKILEK